MEYNIRADWRYAKNGHRTISVGDLRNKIVEAIRDTLNPENIPEYVKQYQRYKEYQKNWQLTAEEKKDLGHIAIGNKKVSDFPDKDYLKNLYIKYFNQEILPVIKTISWQVKNHLGYHGIWHTEQVALFIIDISVEENVNPLPNLLAAALHDCARKNDGGDYEHGKNCEPIARDYLDNLYKDSHLLTQNEKEEIVYAVTHHNVPPQDDSHIILNCLQDADSMRLWWRGSASYAAHTPTGQKLSDYRNDRKKQITYLSDLIERMRSFAAKSTDAQVPPNKHYDDAKILLVLHYLHKKIKEETDDKYLNSYIKLENAYTILRDKCKRCGGIEGFNAPDCGKCNVSKIKYHINKAIMCVNRLAKSADDSKYYVAIHEICREHDIKLNYSDVLHILLLDATLSCGKCEGYLCQGCVVAIQHIHLSEAINLIRESGDDIFYKLERSRLEINVKQC